jgi:hypothetical protein
MWFLIPKLQFLNTSLENSLALTIVVNAHPQLAILFINKQDQCPIRRFALPNIPPIEKVID